MRAHHIRLHAVPNQPLVVPIPTEIPEGEVDVIILYPETAQKVGPFSSLREFNAWLRQQPPSQRSREEIDRQIAEERASWD